MITSRQNGLVKRFRSLKDKKERDVNGEFVVEGVRAVKDAVICKADISVIAVTPDKYNDFCDFGIQCEVVAEDVFRSLSEESSPQGVIAIVNKPQNTPLTVNKKCLFLDGVSDPSNVGAVIRSAAAFGYGIVMIADGADPYSGKAVRASMGGIFRVNVIVGKRAELLKTVDLPIISADMHGEALFDADVPAEHCLVIGNEAHGVSEEVKQASFKTVAIPMQNGMESLNAAVSAGIIMFNLTYKK